MPLRKHEPGAAKKGNAIRMEDKSKVRSGATRPQYHPREEWRATRKKVRWSKKTLMKEGFKDGAQMKG